ncbi:RND efflux transporter [mine drainage metagenome]|uniref:RND efflux transporter n=1 Tax=mine drainage metagenome TaxID=410659 RepID=T0Y5H3_9ZZZZ
MSAARHPVQLVLIHPVLEANTLQPGLAATQALMRISDSLPDVRDGRVRIDYTGSVALSDVQFGALTHGIVVSTLASLALIALWLYLAVRSWRLIVPILLTLLGGFALTLGFAAIGRGHPERDLRGFCGIVRRPCGGFRDPVYDASAR